MTTLLSSKKNTKPFVSAPPSDTASEGDALTFFAPRFTPARLSVGGIGFDDVSMTQAVESILAMVRKGTHPAMVCTGNLDHLVLLDKDAAFRDIYAAADLVLADGWPVLLLSRQAADANGGRVLQERVTGSDLFWELGRASEVTGVRLFFLGGMPGAADAAAGKLAERFPGVNVCGTYCPPRETFHTDEEQAHIESLIRAAAPDVLLVGLGAPKQEKWIAAHKHRLGVPVSIGVGGSFEMAAGVVKRAPQWVQRFGLEWAFRLLQDPSRLASRYLQKDLPFLIQLLLRGAMPSFDTNKSAIF